MNYRPSICKGALTVYALLALYFLSSQAIANVVHLNSNVSNSALSRAAPDAMSGVLPGAQCIDFGEQHRDFGSVTDDIWRLWMPAFRFATGEEHLAVQIESDTANLRHKYVPTDRGSDRVVVGSHLEPHSTYRLSQMVFLEHGWEWGGDTFEGGKLGFGFGGGTTPSGGIVDLAGFTARIMWRGNYLGGGKYDGSGRLVVYSYAADRPENIGEDYFIGDYSVPIGEWFNIAYEIKANSSITKSDGHAKAWVNGELLLEETGIAWQQAGDSPVIDTLYYSSFYGGSNRGWAPSKTTYAKFKDVCWAPVIDGESGIDPDNELYLIEPLPTEPRAPDDAMGSKGPEWLELKRNLLQKTEEASVYINVIAPDSLAAGPQYYTDSLNALNQTMDTVRVVSGKYLSENASQLNSVTDIELQEMSIIKLLLKETIEQYPALAEMVVRQAQQTAGCDDTHAGHPSCLSSLSSLAEVQSFISTLNYNRTDDMSFISWQAEQAWNSSVDAINFLEPVNLE